MRDVPSQRNSHSPPPWSAFGRGLPALRGRLQGRSGAAHRGTAGRGGRRRGAALLRELVRLDVAYRCAAGRRFRRRSICAVPGAGPGLAGAPYACHVDPGAAGARPGRNTAARPAGAGDRGGGVAGPGYEVLGELGRGGMGVVYLARNVLMDRGSAEGREQGALDKPGVMERFLREIRSAAMLRHNNMVRPTAVQAGEYCSLRWSTSRGRTSTRWCSARTAADPIACHYVSQAAMGLQHAHETDGHRDVKPQT